MGGKRRGQAHDRSKSPKKHGIHHHVHATNLEIFVYQAESACSTRISPLGRLSRARDVLKVLLGEDLQNGRTSRAKVVCVCINVSDSEWEGGRIKGIRSSNLIVVEGKCWAQEPADDGRTRRELAMVSRKVPFVQANVNDRCASILLKRGAAASYLSMSMRMTGHRASLCVLWPRSE